MKNLQSYDDFLNEAVKMSSSYFLNLLNNFDTYTKITSIGGWNLNMSLLEKDHELVWQKDNYSLYTYLFSDKKEIVEFKLISDDDPKLNLKRLVGFDTLPQKYTENYMLDIANYTKNVEKFIKKLNSIL
jgi:hypothetical protein